VNYTNVWGVAARGKPTFFPTRIVEDAGTRTYGYPAWRLAPGGLHGQGDCDGRHVADPRQRHAGAEGRALAGLAGQYPSFAS
jgi:hypothetical protein